MRPHGRAAVSPAAPRAWGVCDRCGFLYNHYELRWQKDWRGPKIQNLRRLVCQPCYDAYQQNGQRTIILPPDPVPIQNARPEYYVQDDNPLSPLGMMASVPNWQYGSRIGNMVNFASVPSAFDGNANKPDFQSAVIVTANSSYNNYVGINWQGGAQVSTPSSLSAPALTHTLSSFTITAPNNTTFGSTAYVVQGSSIGDSTWASWTTLYSGSPVGSVGESISATPTGGKYQYHRVAFYQGSGQIGVAQVSFSVSDGGST